MDNHLSRYLFLFADRENIQRTEILFSETFRRFVKATHHRSIVARLLYKAVVFKRYISLPSPFSYISLQEEDEMISYLPSNRMMEIIDGKWSTKGRQLIKPAKFARSLLHPRIVKKLSEADFNEFASYFKNYINENKIILRVVPVKDAYLGTYDDAGTGSCMANKQVHDFYDCFDCQALVAINNRTKNLMGRALLWPNVHVKGLETPINFMDRIYFLKNKPELVDLFKTWANQNGYYHKYAQNNISTKCSIVSPDGKILDNPQMAVSRNPTKKILNKYFKPYIDTLSFSDSRRTILSNIFKFQKGVHFKLKNTDNISENLSHYNECIINSSGETDFDSRSNSVLIKGKRYRIYSNDLITELYIPRLGYRYFLTSDPNLFTYQNERYHKKYHVIIDKKVYSKDDRRIQKTKNNRWELIESVKDKENKIDGLLNKIKDINNFYSSNDDWVWPGATGTGNSNPVETVTVNTAVAVEQIGTNHVVDANRIFDRVWTTTPPPENPVPQNPLPTEQPPLVNFVGEYIRNMENTGHGRMYPYPPANIYPPADNIANIDAGGPILRRRPRRVRPMPRARDIHIDPAVLNNPYAGINTAYYAHSRLPVPEINITFDDILNIPPDPPAEVYNQVTDAAINEAIEMTL